MIGRLLITIALVILTDQATKTILRRRLGSRAASLGPLGHVRLVQAQTWIERLGGRRPPWVLAASWMLAACALVLLVARLPAALPCAGLLLGGSLSHALESPVRGAVTDYICLRFWPAFNLADVAITAGALGVAAHVILHVS